MDTKALCDDSRNCWDTIRSQAEVQELLTEWETD